MSTASTPQLNMHLLYTAILLEAESPSLVQAFDHQMERSLSKLVRKDTSSRRVTARVFLLLAILNFVVLLSLRLFRFESVLSAILRDDPDWSLLFVPSAWFLVGYVAELFFLAAAVAFWFTGQPKASHDSK